MAMEMNGTERILASNDKVWAALNDPDILKACIPGCESVEIISPTEMTAKVAISIGPIKARFGGAIKFENIVAPTSYTIVGEGKSGMAGFAKGGADVALTAESDGITVLTYNVRADVGGKLAQLGSRMLMSTAQKLAGQFFTRLNETVSAA
ncbi:SRPBCC family protein [Rhizobium lusitanum]|uniref:SRPBCC family protein n=1 Tax=Rhizobium lusitanum TaxID=293958 RepID=UPI0015725957|nr:carbon monoxide dehydrogenase subunit G [Rhizobium lusitanum]NTJ11580.1 carbon monoxide dehydrogenase subunit G [Rhizobium lusitanum]